jgi:hypothetical protein
MAAKSGTANILLRLDAQLADKLRTIAQVEGRTVSDVVREALATHVDSRRKDPEFGRLLRQNMAKHKRVLDDLGRRAR